MRQKIIIAVAVVFVAIQFFPVDRDNPPTTQNLEMPVEVEQIIRPSCFDCHSNETNWPWYSYIAPVSWLVSQDVKEGREHLNFSEWDQLSEKKKKKRLEELVEEIEEERMPLPIYVLLHPEAKITDSELDTIREWVQQELDKLSGADDHRGVTVEEEQDHD
jgi:hypothetical protein